MKLSEHFTLDELTRSDTATRLGIDNAPDAEALAAIREHLAPGLERVRALLGVPLLISSGYRSPQLNAQIPGSSDTSAHTLGFAADFTAPAYGSPWDICQAVATGNIRFDQLIYEYGQWVHVSFDPRGRGQVLTKLSGQPYRSGLHRA